MARNHSTKIRELKPGEDNVCSSMQGYPHDQACPDSEQALDVVLTISDKRSWDY